MESFVCNQINSCANIFLTFSYFVSVSVCKLVDSQTLRCRVKLCQLEFMFGSVGHIVCATRRPFSPFNVTRSFHTRAPSKLTSQKLNSGTPGLIYRTMNCLFYAC